MDSPGELRKVQLVGPSNNNPGKIWRRDIPHRMTDEMDDVAFLTGILGKTR